MRSSRAVALVVVAVSLLLAASLLPVAGFTHRAAVQQAGGEVLFTASGDYSSNARATAVFQALRTIDPDLHLALGDLSYGQAGQEQVWCEQVLATVGAGFPFELISGNHEMNGLNGNINDFSACLPNQVPGLVGIYGREWYVDVPQVNPLVRFVMISPGLTYKVGETYDYSIGSNHYQWAESTIDGARTKSIPWVVVGMHMPCLSLGEYACSSGADLNNLLIAKKVDLVLQGHEHLYQRTKQLATNPGCSAVTPGAFNPSCVVDSDNQMTKGSGTVFATIGTGGQTLRDVNVATDPEAAYFAKWSGNNADPTWGSLRVAATADMLDASFDRAVGGTFADNFQITSAGQPPNVAPVARMSQTCTGLSCSFDASASSDIDGSITSYSWDFGDGSSATGARPTHPFSKSGSYTVAVTATDDKDASGTASTNVTVSSPSLLASDSFTRSIPSGLGAAETGGSWAIGGGVANTWVDGSRAAMKSNAGNTVTATLSQVNSANTDVILTLCADKLTTGTGLFASVIGRRIANKGDFRAKVRFTTTGNVGLSLVRATATGNETTIQNEVATGLTYSNNADRMRLRLQVTGSNPTTVRAKVWKLGSPEPAGWQRSVTDTTAGMQATGAVGVMTYLSSSATNAPVTLTVDDFTATTP